MADANISPYSSDTPNDKDPSRNLLPTRKRTKKKKTTAERNADKLKRAQAQEKAQHLSDELENYFEKEEKDVAEIAERTGYSVDQVRKALKTSAMKRTQKREPTAHNGMVSFKIKELNKDIPDGEEKIDVKTFAAMVEKNPSLKDMTESQQKEAMDALLEKRRTQAVGVRGTTRGVTVEGLAAMGKIADTLHTVNSHGSLVGFACVTKSSVNQSFNAAWAGTEGVPEFFKEILGASVDEVLLLYEQWECNRSNRPRTKNLPSLQKHCAKLITDNLHLLLEKQSVAMKYKHYERLICLKYRVKLRGWPDGIEFDSPYQLGRIEDLEKLRDALRSGECKWVKMKQDEYSELQKKVDAEEAPSRETRSDKGQKRKRADKENDSTLAQGKAKTKSVGGIGALQKRVEKRLPTALRAVKSKEFIDSEEEDSDGDDEGAVAGEGQDVMGDDNDE